ncbi:unnamed protein product, partial [Ectocarpus sp. 12 AP-2014]
SRVCIRLVVRSHVAGVDDNVVQKIRRYCTLHLPVVSLTQNLKSSQLGAMPPKKNKENLRFKRPRDKSSRQYARQGFRFVDATIVVNTVYSAVKPLIFASRGTRVSGCLQV